MNSLKSQIMSIASIKNEEGEKLASLRKQIEHKEKECSKLRHQCALLCDENSEMKRQLEIIHQLVFETRQ